MRRFVVKILSLLEIILLIALSSILFFQLFFPLTINRRNYPATFEIKPDKIIFEAVLNNNHKQILNLISLDARGWISSLNLWDKNLFQKALDKSSLFLTGLDLRIFQDWIINNNVDYYSKLFPGKIIFVFEGDNFHKEVSYKTLIRNYKDLSLENIIFLGLGLQDFLRNFSQGRKIASPQVFLERLFNKGTLRVIINKNILPKTRCKLKIFISGQ